MKTHKRKLPVLLLLAIFCLSLCLLNACGGKTDDPSQTDDNRTDYGIDNVYYAKDDGREYLFTISGNSFLISGFNGEQSGKFVYADGELTLTFKDGDDTQASAVLENGVLKLTYNGGTYRLVPRTYYTVGFDVDGGSAVPVQMVLNGGTATKPADPSKSGYAFIGWYTDKEYKTAFAFDTTVISADTTVYARFELHAAGQPEYKVSFACDGAVYDPIRTVNGIAYQLPTPVKEGAEFVGWWVSDYQSGEKLTYQYTGQKLTEDTTLFAVFRTAGVPNVSVSADKITWDALGPTASYRVTVKMGDKVLEDKNVGTNEFKFDFAGQAAGEYTVTVTCDGKSATAYYKNKALGRVSNFRVVSGSILVFDPVANAQSYLITVRCGNANHTHTAINNGSSTNFVFANCDMPKDGIVFVVVAKADGYLDSASSYTYYQGLDAVTGVTVDNGKITWYPVENATAYYVEISRNGKILKNAYVTSGTTYSIADLDAGAISVKVTPVSAGYYSAPAEAVEFTKTTLARPSGITAAGSVIRWDKVEGATGYKVSVNGTVYDTTDATFTITEEMIGAGNFVYSVSVQAVATDAANSSPYSESVSVYYASMGDIVYRNGVLSWTPVMTASSYRIKIGTKTYTVDSKSSSFKVTFLEAGTTEISVSFINENGDESARKTITVEVYGVEFDVRGGAAVKTVYVAFGDEINLPETSRDGYDFAGWFTSPAGLSGGKRYENVRFEGNSDTVLYAGWSAKRYNVTLTPGEGGTVDSTTAEVIYGLYNKLPVASHSDPTRLFVGWFSEPNGVGIRYTDEKGEALIRWNLPSETTLYAYFAETLKFTPIENGTAYAVSQGDYGIGSLTTITIPTSYNGLPVTTVEASAFVSCNTLVEIRIPNTIKLIEIGSEGINGVGSAFQNCNNLREITIYSVEGAKDVRYHSVDGVLYYNNEFTGMEIKAYPYAKTGALEIEEGTTVIPTGVFKSAKFTEVIVPHTVTEIHANAFQSCSNLTKVTFLVAPDGVAEVPLTMRDKAIYSCSKLESVTLPARLTSFGINTISSCSALSSIDIAGTGGNYTAKGEAGRKVLCNAAGDTIIFCPKGMTGEFTVPSGITTIAPNAFQGCNKLSKVTIPGFVTEIQKEAFKSCSGLEAIDLTEEGYGLTICESAFYSCSGLTSVTLPKRLVKMEANAFGYTSKLTKVIVNAAGVAAGEGGTRTVDFATNAFGSIPSSSTAMPLFYVTHVELGAEVPEFEITGVFGQKIESVTVHAQNPNYTAIDGVLFDKAVTKVVYYPTDRNGSYTLPETITEIGDRVFQGKTGLTGITIGKNVKTIGVGAFRGCNKLEFVKFADSTVELTIGDDAFNGCSGLNSIQLPARLTDIGANAFASCSKLTTLTVPEKVTHIGSGAFASCSNLTEISLPKSLKAMDLNEKAEFTVFNACSMLAKITVASDNPYFVSIDNVLYQRTDKPVLDSDGNKVLDAEGKETTVSVISTLLFCPQKKAGSSTVTVPGTVTMVAAKAFYNNQVVTEILFEALEKGASLTIGDQAFGSCAALAKIALPEGLSEIPASMFYGCKTLEEIVIPSTVASIGNKAFYGCSNLKTLSFTATPAGQTPVELVILDAAASGGSDNGYTNSPFYGCTNLKNIVLPERLTVIGRLAFGGLVSGEYGEYYIPTFETISLPSTLKEIHENAFLNARYLKSVTFAPGTTFTDACDGKTFAIGKQAFYHCDSLTSIVLPASTDPEKTYSIGDSAFSYSGLTEIVIPKAVAIIGNSVFNRCTALATVTFETGANPVCGTSLFAYTVITGVTLPEGMETIGNYMFQGCSYLTSVTIPASVKSIGISAFESCQRLTKITFATYEKDGSYYSSLNTIGNFAFSKTGITSFTFPTLEGSSTLSIGNSIFRSCMKLETIGLSKSVAEIGTAFADCFSIRSFVVDSDNQNFSSKPGSPILYNANGTAYKYICGQLPAGEYVIPEGITSIGDNVFKGQLGITRIVIPRSMQTIGSNAFEGCTLLETVIFEHSTDKPSQLTQDDSYGTNLFKNCTSLKYVTLPANITEIPASMFYSCSSLETIVIPYGVTSIGASAFYQTGLKSVSIPATVQTIGNSAFIGRKGEGTITSLTFEKEADGSTALTTIGNTAFEYQAFPTVEIPKSVTSIGNNPFSYNPALVSFTFEEGTQIKSFGTSLIANCPLIETFIVPKSVTTLGNNDFENCTSLKTVIFEEGSQLTKVGSSTFRGSGIETIVFPEGVTTFTTVAKPSVTTSNTLFKDCVNLRSVTFGSKTVFLAQEMFSGCTALESIEIPDTVTMIGAKAFLGSGLKSITFGEKSQLTSIGQNCFENSALESIVLPASFTKFGYNTSYAVGSSGKQFLNCKNLKSVAFMGKLEVICGYVFQGCESLESIEIPATVTIIGNYAFDGCTSLKSATINSSGSLVIGTYAFRNSGIESVTIPKGTTKIDTSAFNGCTSLTTVDFAAGTASLTLGTSVFENCTSLTAIALPDRVKAIPNYAFRYDSALATVTFNKVTTIGNAAFQGTGALSALTLPSTLTSIGSDAFLNSGLESITIPKGTTAIGDNAFGGCSKLATFSVEAGNTKYDVTIGALVEVSGGVSKIIALPGGLKGVLTVPEGVTLGGYALNGLTGITQVILPEGTTKIEANAFRYSTIKSVIIPSTVTEIGDGAFRDSSITSIVIPASVTTLGEYAFADSENLVSITFEEGSQLVNLGRYVFQGTAIQSIVLPAGVVRLGSTDYIASYTFRNCKQLASVTFLGELVAINPYAFYGCEALKSFTIPETVTVLGSNAFEESGLETIEIPAGLKALCVSSSSLTMSGYTFRNCKSLKTVILHEGLECINAYAFKGCDALETIVIPSTVTSIGSYAFQDCINLKTVVFAADSQLEKIDYQAFVGSGLVSFEMPDSVKTLGKQVFSDCAQLVSVKLSNSLGEIPEKTFFNCVALEGITIPASVKTLGAYAFQNSGIRSLTVPATLTSFNTSSFKECHRLEKVVFEEGCTIVTGSMFSGCENLKSVTLASTITSISATAFANCTSIKEIIIPLSVASMNGSVFDGWTADQTIKFMCSESDSSLFGTTWRSGCNATIVWNYDPTAKA